MVSQITFSILGTIFLVIYAIQQEWHAIPPASFFDGTFLWVALGLFLFPFVRSLKLGKILEIERDVQKAQEQVTELKEDTRQQLGILFNSINTISNVNSTVHNITLVQGSVPAEKVQLEGPPASFTVSSGLDAQSQRIYKQHTAEQLKILNTLWVGQVNNYPQLNLIFTFKPEARIPSSPEVTSFCKAVEGLKQEGLIKREDDGHVGLTMAGLKYCLKRYEEFPSDMYFAQVPLNEMNLEILKGLLND